MNYGEGLPICLTFSIPNILNTVERIVIRCVRDGPLSKEPVPNETILGNGAENSIVSSRDPDGAEGFAIETFIENDEAFIITSILLRRPCHGGTG